MPQSGATASRSRSNSVLQEKHHGGVVVLAALGAAIEQIADRIETDDVGQCFAETVRDRRRDHGNAALVEQHAQLRRGDEIVARRGDYRRLEPDSLQALAQIVVLDFRLQVEYAQRVRRHKAEEGHAGRHVHQEVDEKVALTDLRRAAQHQQTAGRQQTRRNDVLRHGRAVVQQRAERECRHRLRHGRFRVEAQERRAVLLDMTAPQPLGFLLQPLERPGRPQHGGVILANGLPAVIGTEAAVMH